MRRGSPGQLLGPSRDANNFSFKALSHGDRTWLRIRAPTLSVTSTWWRLPDKTSLLPGARRRARLTTPTPWMRRSCAAMWPQQPRRSLAANGPSLPCAPRLLRAATWATMCFTRRPTCGWGLMTPRAGARAIMERDRERTDYDGVRSWGRSLPLFLRHRRAHQPEAGNAQIIATDILTLCWANEPRYMTPTTFRGHAERPPDDCFRLTSPPVRGRSSLLATDGVTAP